jgi:CYTH domain-containing protein
MLNLEIERKFLLKSLPKIEPDEIIKIEQYYLKNDEGVWERARTYHSNVRGDFWIHTIKKSLSKGVNIEDERHMSEKEFNLFVSKCKSGKWDSRFIEKERIIYKDGELKWEVDNFLSGYSLIIAELEVPKKRFKIQFPDFITDVMLLEVTGLKQFSNRSLSLPI